jgi:hypothetical protein
MRSRVFYSLWVLIVLCALSGTLFASTAQTYLYLNSQPGDYIGGGLQQTFTTANGTFSVSNGPSTVNVAFNSADHSQWWYLNFGSPKTIKFARGQYVSAQRTPFRGPNPAGH